MLVDGAHGSITIFLASTLLIETSSASVPFFIMPCSRKICHCPRSRPVTVPAGYADRRGLVNVKQATKNKNLMAAKHAFGLAAVKESGITVHEKTKKHRTKALLGRDSNSAKATEPHTYASGVVCKKVSEGDLSLYLSYSAVSAPLSLAQRETDRRLPPQARADLQRARQRPAHPAPRR
jgi:hypothetical protein